MMDSDNLRWWGWGTLERNEPSDGWRAFWSTVQAHLRLSDEQITRTTPPTSLDDISLRPPRLDDPVLSSLRRLVGQEALRTDKLARIVHARGKSYGDLVCARAGHFPNPPDAVVYPADSCHVASLLAWAADRDIAVIPFGGGSSVLGGIEPASDGRPTISLDVARLNRVS